MSISVADIERRSKLHPDLAKLPEKFARIVPLEPRSVCSLHGVQDGPNCEQCDAYYPEAVAARKIAAGAAPVGAVTIEQLLANPIVQKMIQDSVAEQIKFQQWKASAEGQTAAAETITAQASDEAKAAAVQPKSQEELIAEARARLAELEGGSEPSA